MRLRKSIYSLLIILCICGLIIAPVLSAETARDRHAEAEGCYRNLSKSPKKQKYRDNWLECIEKFQSVYRYNPSGSWAAAGLYMSGKLYKELYGHSYKSSDKQEAIDLFERVINRHPDSAYRPKAEAEKKSLLGGTKKKKPSQRVSASEKTARDTYSRADRCYRGLKKDTKKRKYRDNWLTCIDGFQQTYELDPSGPWAAAGLYRSGILYQELFGYSYRTSDQEEALDIFRQIVSDYPKSGYNEKARAAIRDITGSAPITKPVKKPQSEPVIPKKVTIAEKKEPVKAVEKKPEQTVRSDTSKKPPPTSGGPTHTITGLRYWSNPTYTRIVVDADGEMPFSHRLLKKDPAIGKPQRLYIDIQNGVLGKDISRTVPINDNLLTDARAGQYAPDTVRVVVDIKSFETYKIFPLKDPFRIVIDVRGGDADYAIAEPSPEDEEKSSGKIDPSALAKQLALGVKRIVIDPGHGGKDHGAPGYLKGVHEKDITLKMAKKLAKRIRKELGCEVILTRTTDKFLTLEERTAIANTKNADLFISIHTNAHKNRSLYGIMTFILNLATDDESIRIAARENETSTKNISDLQTILSELMRNAKINESSRLASHVQKSICQHLKQKYSRIKSRGVKQAPFYVLLGAEMPAILIETSFISNSRECKRLTNTTYQDRMSEGIINGIKAYIKETTPSAFLQDQSRTDKKG